MKHIITVGLPLVFTLVLIRALWNYSGGNTGSYFYLSMAAPFLIVIFFGLFKILTALIKRLGPDSSE